MLYGLCPSTNGFTPRVVSPVSVNAPLTALNHIGATRSDNQRHLAPNPSVATVLTPRPCQAAPSLKPHANALLYEPRIVAGNNQRRAESWRKRGDQGCDGADAAKAELSRPHRSTTGGL